MSYIGKLCALKKTSDMQKMIKVMEKFHSILSNAFAEYKNVRPEDIDTIEPCINIALRCDTGSMSDITTTFGNETHRVDIADDNVLMVFYINYHRRHHSPTQPAYHQDNFTIIKIRYEDFEANRCVTLELALHMTYHTIKHAGHRIKYASKGVLRQLYSGAN